MDRQLATLTGIGVPRQALPSGARGDPPGVVGGGRQEVSEVPLNILCTTLDLLLDWAVVHLFARTNSSDGDPRRCSLGFIAFIH